MQVLIAAGLNESIRKYGNVYRVVVIIDAEKSGGEAQMKLLPSLIIAHE